MEFCKKCKSVMLPAKKGKSAYLKCKVCGSKRKISSSFKLQSDDKHAKIIVIEKNEMNLPTTHKLCPKCGRERAFWWTQQTRPTDESPTNFFKCTKCTYTWREY